MAKKVYAVRKGRQPGLYETWDDCKAQVDGFPGAVYKSFTSPEEAQVWLGDEGPSRLAEPSTPVRPAPVVETEPLVSSGPPEVLSDDDLPPWDLTPEEEAQLRRPRSARVPEDGAGGAVAVASTPQVDYREKRAAKARAFVAYLRQHGFPAYEAESNSEHYERLGLEGGGCMDLYLTSRTPFKLQLTRFADPEHRREVERLWRRFLWGLDDPSPAQDAWAVVEHYYGVLKPFAHLKFDFISLAAAIEQASGEVLPAEEVRYDFPRIEAAYLNLRSRCHG